MPNALVWDKTGEKLYETGVEQTALYVQDETGAYPKGVAWNGVSNITEQSSGGEPEDIYADDQKYLSLMSPENHEGSITAYMSPPEFDVCDGSVAIVPGATVGQQTRKVFGLVYKTLVGNDTEDTDYGYKLHLVWGAKASPSEKSHDTVNESPEATELNWDYTTTPIRSAKRINGKRLKPFAHMVLYSKALDSAKLEKIEKVLYGSAEAEAKLPLPDEIIDMLQAED